MVGDDLVPGPLSSLLSFEEARLDEDGEVVANGGLTSSDWLGEVAEADFAFGVVGDEAQEPKSNWIGQHLEGGSQGLCFVGGDGLDKEWRTALFDHGHATNLVHTLTLVDLSV